MVFKNGRKQIKEKPIENKRLSTVMTDYHSLSYPLHIILAFLSSLIAVTGIAIVIVCFVCLQFGWKFRHNFLQPPASSQEFSEKTEGGGNNQQSYISHQTNHRPLVRSFCKIITLVCRNKLRPWVTLSEVTPYLCDIISTVETSWSFCNDMVVYLCFLSLADSTKK